MHAAFSGFSLRLLTNCFDPKFNTMRFYIKPKIRKIINGRILKFGSTSRFKRFPRSLEFVYKWKSNETFQFFFYIFPVCFKSIIDDEFYKYYLVLIYIISSLWERTTLDKLEQIDKLVNLFINDLEKVVSIYEHTINIHSLSHLALIVLLFGPLKYLNAFVFEHFIGRLKKYVNSPYAVNEQIRKDYSLDFFLKINSEKAREKNTLKLLGRYKRNGKIFYSKIIKNDVQYSSIDRYKNEKNRNFYLETLDSKFYLVKHFSIENDLIYFKGFEIKKLSPFKFSYKTNDLSLDYITHCEITDKICKLPISQISKNLHYVSQFKDNSSSFLYERKGYIINLEHKYHN